MHTRTLIRMMQTWKRDGRKSLLHSRPQENFSRWVWALCVCVCVCACVCLSVSVSVSVSVYVYFSLFLVLFSFSPCPQISRGECEHLYMCDVGFFLSIHLSLCLSVFCPWLFFICLSFSLTYPLTHCRFLTSSLSSSLLHPSNAHVHSLSCSLSLPFYTSLFLRMYWIISLSSSLSHPPNAHVHSLSYSLSVFLSFSASLSLCVSLSLPTYNLPALNHTLTQHSSRRTLAR